MSDLDKEISPFTVKDALYTHERRLSDLSDEIKNKTHDTQAVVKSFEEKFAVLMDRINKGVSPTMQEIKEKSHDIEKSIISMEGAMKLGFADVRKDMEVRDVENAAKFKAVEKEIDNRLQVSDEIIRGVKYLFLKLVGWVGAGALIAFVSMWLYIQSLKTSLVSLPTEISVRRK